MMTSTRKQAATKGSSKDSIRARKPKTRLRKTRLRKMTNEDFIKWQNLIHRVVRDNFKWAFDSRANYRRFKRPMGYDDMIQEGSIALHRSWQKYDGKREDAASFKTYAYRAIYRRVSRYISNNITPVTIKNWSKAAAKEGNKDSVAAAISCSLFSEVVEPGGEEWSSQIKDRTVDAGVRDMIHQEHVGRCIGILKDGLTRREFGIMIEKNRGKTYAQIAKRRRMTRENVRSLYSCTLVKCAVLLLDQEQYYGSPIH